MMNLDIEVGRDGYEICPNYVTILTRPQKTKVTKYKKSHVSLKEIPELLGNSWVLFSSQFQILGNGPWAKLVRFNAFPSTKYFPE